MDERNVKILSDHRKSRQAIKFNNSKTLWITRFVGALGGVSGVASFITTDEQLQ